MPRKTWPQRLVEWIFVAAVISGLTLILWPADLHRFHPAHGPVIDCGDRLRVLMAATLYYAESHDGSFPDDPKTCPDIRELPARFLICPASGLELGRPRTDLAGALLDSGAPTSYIYLGRGVKSATSPDVAIWIEPLGDHENYGMLVAYADGHVSWELKELIDPLLKQVAAGTRPVRYPLESTTQP